MIVVERCPVRDGQWARRVIIVREVVVKGALARPRAKVERGFVSEKNSIQDDVIHALSYYCFHRNNL